MKYIFITLFLLTSSLVFAQRDYPGTMTHIQDLYNQGKGDSIYALFSDKMRGMMTPESAKKTFDGLLVQFGHLQSYNLLKTDTQYCLYKAVFEKQTLYWVSICKIMWKDSAYIHCPPSPGIPPGMLPITIW
jgi:hypothetical protein